MSELKLIYFKGCPKADKFRDVLKAAGFQGVIEVEQTALPEKHKLRGYVSPTILYGEQIVYGAATEDLSGGCSLDNPNVEELKKRVEQFGGNNTPPPKGRVATIFGSFGSAFTAGLCPVCIPALGAFLSSIGLGFLVQEAVLKPILIGFLFLAVAGFAWSYFKVHKKLLPLILGALFAIGVYVGRYVLIGTVVNSIIMYGSIVGIIGVSIWNLRLKKRASCPSCIEKN